MGTIGWGGYVWTHRDRYGPIGTGMDPQELVWTYKDQYGPYMDQYDPIGSTMGLIQPQ